MCYWGFILKQGEEEQNRKVPSSSQEEKVTRLPKDGWSRTSPHWMLYMLGHVP